MATQPDTPPVVSSWPTPTPSRARPLDFAEEADAFLGHFPTGQNDQQNVVDWTNQTAQQVYDNAVEAASSSLSAEQSASTASSAANIKGKWANLSGAYSPPSSVEHNGLVWILLVSLSDITLSEPSTSNSDWLLNGSISKSYILSDSDLLLPSVINEINATQSNPLPLASSVPANNILQIIVPKQYAGIETTHACSGGDTVTSDGNDTSIILKWLSGGVATFASNGVDNWRRI